MSGVKLPPAFTRLGGPDVQSGQTHEYGEGVLTLLDVQQPDLRPRHFTSLGAQADLLAKASASGRRGSFVVYNACTGVPRAVAYVPPYQVVAAVADPDVDLAEASARLSARGVPHLAYGLGRVHLWKDLEAYLLVSDVLCWRGAEPALAAADELAQLAGVEARRWKASRAFLAPTEPPLVATGGEWLPTGALK